MDGVRGDLPSWCGLFLTDEEHDIFIDEVNQID